MKQFPITHPFKALRVFSVQFFCDECDGQFIDEMLTVSHSWCPNCDSRCEPDGIEQYELELDDEDEEETV